MNIKPFLSLVFAVVATFSTSAQFTGASTATPGFNNIFGPMFNQSGTNVVPANFGTGLATLQNDIQQLLPVLADLNDAVDFSAVGAALPSSTTNATSSTALVPVSRQRAMARPMQSLTTAPSKASS